MTQPDQDRADFESAMKDHLGIPLDCYVEAYRDGAWRGWNACIAHERTRAQGEPVAMPDERFQARVDPWMQARFGPAISADRLERGDRLLEEVLELLQSGGYPAKRVSALTGYVWSRPAGDPPQEVGGVMVTLAAYCLAHGLDMHEAGETELARIWTKVEKIRAKQAAKPTGSALPQAWPTALPAESEEGGRLRDALKLVRGIIVDGAMTGFNCHDGDWAQRLFESQGTTARTLAHTPAPTPEPAKEFRGWYCPHCQRGIDGSEVTFHEQHEVCGTYIGDADPPPPEPAKAEVAAALDELGALVYGGVSKGGASLARALKVVRTALATPPTAPAAAEVPPSALHEPYAWWAETGTAGAGDGCNKPFWLRHEAVAYVQQHGGHVAPLFRRWSAAPAAARSAEWKPTHRHVKRGSTYCVIGEAEAQVSTGARITFFEEWGERRPAKDWWERTITDGDRLYVYQGADGKLWCRFSDEFNDGRFVALPGEEA